MVEKLKQLSLEDIENIISKFPDKEIENAEDNIEGYFDFEEVLYMKDKNIKVGIEINKETEMILIWKRTKPLTNDSELETGFNPAKEYLIPYSLLNI